MLGIAGAPAAPQRATGRSYWQAQGIAELSLSQFSAAADAPVAPQRRAYYTLAGYYGRTRQIVRTSIAGRREPLAQAALQNLITMHRPLVLMHHAAPDAVPLALILERAARDDMARDLVVRVLNDSSDALPETTILSRVNELDVLGPIKPGTVHRHLGDLEASGHVTRSRDGFARASRTYTELDADAASLGALFDPDLYARFEAAGFRGLHDVDARQDAFRETVMDATSLGSQPADLVIEVVTTLSDRPSLRCTVTRRAMARRVLPLSRRIGQTPSCKTGRSAKTIVELMICGFPGVYAVRFSADQATPSSFDCMADSSESKMLTETNPPSVTK